MRRKSKDGKKTDMDPHVPLQSHRIVAPFVSLFKMPTIMTTAASTIDSIGRGEYIGDN